jgi:hypothetical protein
MTIFTSAQAATDQPIYTPYGGRSPARGFGTIAVTAAPVAADTYRMVRLPNGATVTGGWLSGTDIDTGTGVMELDVGWLANATEAANAQGFLDSGAINGTVVANYLAVAGFMLPFAGVLLSAGPKTFTADTTIVVTCTVAPNAFTAGRINLYVEYLTP